MVLCVVHRICGNMKSYSDSKTLQTHLLYKGFMPHYNVWTKHGEIGVMMEDNEEEQDDDNYVPPEYGDAATGEAEYARTGETEDQDGCNALEDQKDQKICHSYRGLVSL